MKSSTRRDHHNRRRFEGIICGKREFSEVFAAVIGGVGWTGDQKVPGEDIGVDGFCEDELRWICGDGAVFALKAFGR